MKLAFSLAIGALLVISFPVQAEEDGHLADVVELIHNHMADKKIPGLSIAIVTDHTQIWTEGFGLADVENDVKATSDTVYRLASVSKAITATAAMKLVEDGKLDLDKPVHDYVVQWPEKKWPITTRQLLSHLGGIRHYRFLEINNTRYYSELENGLAIFSADPLPHEPGTQYLYSTYGYTLAGCAMESASAMDIESLLHKLIFEPSEMKQTQVDNAFEIIPNRAQGYRLGEDGKLRNSNLADTSYKITGGGLSGTAPDLARFAVALMSGKLVSDESRKEMWTSGSTTDGTPTNYGLGWQLSDYDDFQEVAHGGAQQRVSTYLYLCPQRGFSIALLCNLERAKPADLVYPIAKLYLDQ